MFYSYIHSDDSADNWRLRYKYLSLHGPVWANHLVYFPPNLRLLLQLFLYLLTKHTNSVAHLRILRQPRQTHQPVRDLRQRPRAERPSFARRNGLKCKFAVGHVVLAAGLGGDIPKNTEAF